MQQTHMIPCSFPDPDHENERKTGYFHLWGMRSQYVGEKETVIENTVGLVEDEEGDMFIVMPEDIKFNRKREG